LIPGRSCGRVKKEAQHIVPLFYFSKKLVKINKKVLPLWEKGGNITIKVVKSGREW
jgi:hypothetical protein